MPFDGIFMKQITDDAANRLVGARVDKIHQPARESVIIAFRAKTGSAKLLISVNAGSPRFHFTAAPQENPAAPPMFCMLLRKHLTSAKVLEVRQTGLDRVAHMVFETTNELSDVVTRTLVIEIMGRHSNLLLLDERGFVIDAIKRITPEMSRVRPVLPGMEYTPAPSNPRLNLYDVAPSQVWEALQPRKGVPLSKGLQEVLEGVSPLVAREISFHVTRGDDTPAELLTEEEQTRLRFYLSRMSDRLQAGELTPTMLLDTKNKPKDFSYFSLEQYGHTRICRPYETYGSLLDDFYAERDRMDKVQQRSSDLLRLLVNLSERTSRKLAAQKQELADSQKRDELREKGDLLSTNQYRMEKGMKEISVENYFLPEAPLVNIPLDPMKTPSQNIQKYYGAYRKADTAEKKLRELIAQGEGELLYFDTVFDALSRASLEAELSAIRRELEQGGYVRHKGGAKGNKQRAQKLPPLRYRSSDGFEILCGRGNLQNEQLTLKDSRNHDLWFHVQKQAGAHVVIVTKGQPVPNQTLEQAAIIAAFHSKAREGGKTAVDYTEIRNIRKHPANKPGLVLYEPYQTAVVEANEVLVKQLEAK